MTPRPGPRGGHIVIPAQRAKWPWSGKRGGGGGPWGEDHRPLRGPHCWDGSQMVPTSSKDQREVTGYRRRERWRQGDFPSPRETEAGRAGQTQPGCTGSSVPWRPGPSQEVMTWLHLPSGLPRKVAKGSQSRRPWLTMGSGAAYCPGCHLCCVSRQ